MLQINKIHHGDWIKLAEQLDNESIDLIITSPPYWGLRDYGTQNETIWDGNKDCEHEWKSKERKLHSGTTKSKIFGDDSGHLNEVSTIDNFCIKCGAWKGQLGLEPTPQLYIKHLVDGFRILRNKLKKTGSFYLNLGDTYFGSGTGQELDHKGKMTKGQFLSAVGANEVRNNCKSNGKWLQPKQLMLMPSRVAIALQEDGWILRNDIIWHKPNPMPSSVKDRLNTTYEHIFHFVKSRKYYYDLDVIREPHKEQSLERAKRKDLTQHKEYRIQSNRNGEHGRCYEAGKNPGDFVSINTQPFPAAHFAVFPEEICIKPIKSSCPKEICSKCGFIRERIVESILVVDRYTKDNGKVKDVLEGGDKRNVLPRSRTGIDGHNQYKTKGFTNCNCNAGFKPGIVLDPFAGSGTALLVAKKLKRNYIGFELNQEYIKIAEMRLRGCQGWQFKEAEKSKSLKELFQ